MAIFNKYGHKNGSLYGLCAKINRLVNDFIKSDPDLLMDCNPIVLMALGNAINQSVNHQIANQILVEETENRKHEDRTENHRIFDMLEAAGQLTVIQDIHAQYHGTTQAKIPMIRKVREITGCSLSYAKAFIERGYLFSTDVFPTVSNIVP
jgi:ribosomal protein L7/L12